MSRPGDTIAAIATPAGRGGIGIVRVSGPLVSTIIDGILTRRPQPRRAAYGPFMDAGHHPLDAGLALHFPAPNSYTGEETLELHGHGGPVVLGMVLNRCLELGARLAEPGEFTQRAYLNGRLDLAQAESVIDVIEATTERAARGALRSLEGRFSAHVAELRQALIELRMWAEASLDFPEEDLDNLQEGEASRRASALAAQLDLLLERTRQGALLNEGAFVVLAGQPNVGKSSLLNHLAGEEVAIVTEIAGTTRDAIRQTVSLHGIPVHLIDTAGLRESADPVERIGIDRTWQAIHKADVVLLLVDATRGKGPAEGEILARLPAKLRCVEVWNKVDIGSPQVPPGAVGVSAKTGSGIEGLKQALLRAVGAGEEGEAEFIARVRHVRALELARDHIKQGAVEAARLELFAEELRQAQEQINSITGEFTADDLLGEIFSRFCIGK